MHRQADEISGSINIKKDPEDGERRECKMPKSQCVIDVE